MRVLARRKAERDAIAMRMEPVVQPDIEKGTYWGELRWLGENYAAQATTDGLVQHDRLLLANPGDVGEVVTVTYLDGVAQSNQS